MDRRSFLMRVAGGLIAGSGLLAGATESQARRRRLRPARRQMVVDADAADPARPVGPGVHVYARQRPRRHITDSDPNDPVGPAPGPASRFVICPGNARCPRRLP